MTHRHPSDGYLTCRSCGADLDDEATFCGECGTPVHPSRRVAAAAVAPASRRWWVPVAIGIGAIGAIAGGALLAVALTGGEPDPVGADPSAPASMTGPVAETAAADPSSAPSEAPQPTASPTPALAPIVGNRELVRTTAAMELRARGADDAESITRLPPGQQLFIIGAPAEAGDRRWYRVALDFPTCVDVCGEPAIGFVAVPAAADAEPLVETVAVSCPSSPMTVEQLTALTPLTALHCYGRTEITVTGTVETRAGGNVPPFRYVPAWLADPSTPAYLLRAERFGIGFRPVPEAGLEAPARGDVVRVAGHFEDPAAPSCRASVNPAVFAPATPPPDIEPPDPTLLILGCRATFAWTDYEVIGFEDLGP